MGTTEGRDTDPFFDASIDAQTKTSVYGYFQYQHTRPGYSYMCDEDPQVFCVLKIIEGNERGICHWHYSTCLLHQRLCVCLCVCVSVYSAVLAQPCGLYHQTDLRRSSMCVHFSQKYTSVFPCSDELNHSPSMQRGREREKERKKMDIIRFSTAAHAGNWMGREMSWQQWGWSALSGTGVRVCVCVCTWKRLQPEINFTLRSALWVV